MPTNLISIALDGSGHRELRYTHITADYGPGAFEIDPHYNAKTGVSTFTQALHRRNGSIAKRIPLATYGTWEPPSDYRFPLSSFTLNEVGPGGTVGAVVARSPKVDYCMTGDVQVPGYANPPAESVIPSSNCANPRLPLGWSAGWGDEYDQTDAGQPISLVGVPDGTYILRATVDPEHVLREVTTANDVTDTTLKIAGNDVTVLSQKVTKVPLPRVRVTGRRPDLAATVSPPSGKTVRSVQFVLDGRPVGAAQKSAPYTYAVKARARRPLHQRAGDRRRRSDGQRARAADRRAEGSPRARDAARLEGGRARVAAPRTTRIHRHGDRRRARRHLVSNGSLDLRVPKPRRITLDSRERRQRLESSSSRSTRARRSTSSTPDRTRPSQESRRWRSARPTRSE